jgi:hypothetical protein
LQGIGDANHRTHSPWNIGNPRPILKVEHLKRLRNTVEIRQRSPLLAGLLQKLVHLVYHVGREFANQLRKAVCETCIGRRKPGCIQHDFGMRSFRETKKFLCLIPDNVKMADDSLEELEARTPSLTVFKSGKIGGGNANRFR